MVFHSYIFIFFFLPLTLLLFWFGKNKKYRYAVLILSGYIFYGYWAPRYAVLLLAITIISFVAALLIAKIQTNSAKKMVLILAIATDLGLLGFFKYANFFTTNISSVANLFGLEIAGSFWKIILPIGISFYTFQAISYLMDVWRGTIPATKNFLEYSSYAAFFPHLVAGPIVRYKDMANDLDNIGKQAQGLFFFTGINLFVLGLVKKVIIADSIATIIDPMLLDYRALTPAAAWLAVLGYTFQLYFDFSGYSDMAIGLGNLFGIKLPQNFNSPYKSRSITEFWTRWHITLSKWLQDYLFTPLVLARQGTAALTKGKIYLSLVLTMFLGGLWHGASWTFVAWGTYHGLLLVLDKVFAPWLRLVPNFLARCGTFFLVMMSYIFFRSSDFAMAKIWFQKLFSPILIQTSFSGLVADYGRLIILVALSILITQFAPNLYQIRFPKNKVHALVLAALFVICLVLLNYKGSAFIYYQF